MKWKKRRMRRRHSPLFDWEGMKELRVTSLERWWCRLKSNGRRKVWQIEKLNGMFIFMACARCQMRMRPVVSCSRRKAEELGVKFRCLAIFEMWVIPTGLVKEMCVNQKRKYGEEWRDLTYPAVNDSFINQGVTSLPQRSAPKGTARSTLKEAARAPTLCFIRNVGFCSHKSRARPPEMTPIASCI